jgi:hypothetical protein
MAGQHREAVMRNDRGHASASAKLSNEPASPLSEFLNPNSMITPGAAGAFTMTITNTLCQQFGALHLGITGLVVSFLFGAVVFGYGASIAARIVYYVINSLVIFTVAMGSNAIGQQASELSRQAAGQAVSANEAKVRDFNLAGNERPEATGARNEQPSRPAEPPPKPPPKPKFFRNWF